MRKKMTDELDLERKPKRDQAAKKPDDAWVPVCRLDDTRLAALASDALQVSNIPSVLVPVALQAHMFNGMALNDAGLDDPNCELMVPREFHIPASIIVQSVMDGDIDIADLELE